MMSWRHVGGAQTRRRQLAGTALARNRSRRGRAPLPSNTRVARPPCVLRGFLRYHLPTRLQGQRARCNTHT